MTQPVDFTEVYELSHAEQVGLNIREFSDRLIAAAAPFLDTNAAAAQRQLFYRNLHLQDFALASACCLGYPKAWDVFLDRYRAWLYAAALAISRNEHAAKELADSIVGDLFEGKIASYSGRGSLEAWLRALLSHAFIDRYRSERRIVSLHDQVSVLKNHCLPREYLRDAADPRFDSAIEAAFTELAPDERFLLAAYFFDKWTLAKIAVTLGIHESSASRRINHILRALRKSICRRLWKLGMSPAQIEQSFESRDWESTIDIRALLERGLARE